MTSIPVETAPVANPTDTDTDAGEDEIEVLDDLEDLASTATMLGCGDDNPYR